MNFDKIKNAAKGIGDHLSNFSVSGTVCPSGESLANAMLAESLPFMQERSELIFCGIGTGAVADKFIEPARKLGVKALWVDIEPKFCEAFAQKHALEPGQALCCCVGDLFRDRASHPNRLIVSCLPTRGMKFGEFLEDCLCEQVARGAACVFYSYLPHIPGSRFYQIAAAKDCLLLPKRGVLANIPPAFVHTIVPNIPAGDCGAAPC